MEVHRLSGSLGSLVVLAGKVAVIVGSRGDSQLPIDVPIYARLCHNVADILDAIDKNDVEKSTVDEPIYASLPSSHLALSIRPHSQINRLNFQAPLSLPHGWHVIAFPVGVEIGSSGFCFYRCDQTVCIVPNGYMKTYPFSRVTAERLLPAQAVDYLIVNGENFLVSPAEVHSSRDNPAFQLYPGTSVAILKEFDCSTPLITTSIALSAGTLVCLVGTLAEKVVRMHYEFYEWLDNKTRIAILRELESHSGCVFAPEIRQGRLLFGLEGVCVSNKQTTNRLILCSNAEYPRVIEELSRSGLNDYQTVDVEELISQSCEGPSDIHSQFRIAAHLSNADHFLIPRTVTRTLMARKEIKTAEVRCDKDGRPYVL